MNACSRKARSICSAFSIEDDVAFCDLALKHRLVIVSGSGFGYPGYFRLAYCVDRKTIQNSKDAFAALRKEALGK